MPSIAALTFNRRWNSEGTLRIWTIVLDMIREYFHRFIMSKSATLVLPGAVHSDVTGNLFTTELTETTEGGRCAPAFRPVPRQRGAIGLRFPLRGLS